MSRGMVTGLRPRASISFRPRWFRLGEKEGVIVIDVVELLLHRLLGTSLSRS